MRSAPFAFLRYTSSQPPGIAEVSRPAIPLPFPSTRGSRGGLEQPYHADPGDRHIRVRLHLDHRQGPHLGGRPGGQGDESERPTWRRTIRGREVPHSHLCPVSVLVPRRPGKGRASAYVTLERSRATERFTPPMSARFSACGDSSRRWRLDPVGCPSSTVPGWLLSFRSSSVRI